MAAAKVTTVVKAVASPVTMMAGAVHKQAVKSIALTDGELGAKIASHNAAGTDLAATSTKEYFTLQAQLFPYRIARLGDELAAFSANNFQVVTSYPGTASAKDHFMTMRFLIRCMVFFMLGKMACRGSILPLIEPTSPLLPGIYEYHNPNGW